MRRQRLFFLALTIFGVILQDGRSQTNRIVLPSEAEAVFGDAIVDAFFGGCCVEQVYSASEFSGVGGPIFIEELAFRINETGRDNFDSVVGNIALLLKTTDLSMEQIVERGGAGSFGSTLVFSNVNHRLTGRPGINDFPIRFRFHKPFLYVPNDGHLVLTINRTEGYSGSGLSGMDAHGVSVTRGIFTYLSPKNPAEAGMIVTEFLFRQIVLRIENISQRDGLVRLDVSIEGNPTLIALERAANVTGPYLPAEGVRLEALVGSPGTELEFAL